MEDTYHMFWQCSAWTDIRERYRDALLATFDADERGQHTTMQQMADAWPRCFQCCGIAPDLDYSWPRDDPDGDGNAPDPLPPLVETVHAEDPPPPRPPELPAVFAEHWRDGHLCACSDGACENQAEFRRRRAGWAIFCGPGHPVRADFRPCRAPRDCRCCRTACLEQGAGGLDSGQLSECRECLPAPPHPTDPNKDQRRLVAAIAAMCTNARTTVFTDLMVHGSCHR